MPTPILRDALAALLSNAVQSAQDKGHLPPVAVPPSPIERPANPTHGDYASTIALKLARAARMSPREIATILVDELTASRNSSGLLGSVGIAGAGFINFTLSDRWLAEQVGQIAALGPQYGSIDRGHGETVQVEFVSANPTGPLPAASGRGGSLGDSLARVLHAAGFRVEREYYVNDAGRQIETFGQSLYARYLQAAGRNAEIPAGGYHGEYLADLGRHVWETEGERYLALAPDEASRQLGDFGIKHFLLVIQEDLGRLGINYDRWFHESALFQRGEVAKAIGLLREHNDVAEREGAVWFASTTLGEDKDNVLVRSNGEPTYFASDIAYHYNKFVERGFDRVIDVWGADHQGHVSRTRTAVGALGINPDRLRIIIHQLVTLKLNGQPVRMSKRTGNIVLLREVLDEVGPDACRFFFVSRSADTHLDFDLDLARQQSDENPVFYVQYAHARAASILRKAVEVDYSDANLALLTHPAELALIRKMIELPEVVETAAVTLEPHHLPHYAMELAAFFHGQFYSQVYVIPASVSDELKAGRSTGEAWKEWLDNSAHGDDLALTKARLKLVDAFRATMRNTLHLIGVGAPDEMARAAEPE